MKKLMLVSAAIVSLSVPALAADLPVKAPRMPVVVPFTWTSCFLGGHVGGGWAQKDITDPVELVQDAAGVATTGVTTVHLNPSGVVVGGQFGCDYQFAPSWVFGVEGAASGSPMKARTTVGLPALLDTAEVTARTDFLGSVTARFGYAVDRWLLYVRGGAAWAGDKFTVIGAGSDFEGFDWRSGWTVGAGIEYAFAKNWSARLEYDYYGLGTRSVLLNDNINGGSGNLDVKQNAQTVKLGVNFHVWGP
jgi:outer membrane immunogenic protein